MLQKIKFKAMKIKYISSLLLLFCIYSSTLKANNLVITNVSANQAASTISFTISWDNSWNIAGTGAPNNWDAVWIFIKYKDCNDPITVPFTAAILDPTAASRTIPATLEPMSTVNLNGANNLSGLNNVEQSAVIAGDLDYNDGIMLRRSTIGSGTIAPAVVTLTVPALPPSPALLNVVVVGIEMVYVPQEDFLAGDGNGASTAISSHMNAAVANTSGPMTITNAFETGASTFYLNNPGVTTIAGVPAAWPKGQCGFYMMKHEITQGLYTQFLNTLSNAQYPSRNIGNFNTNRNRVQIAAPVDPLAPFSTDRPGRSQNFLSWADYTAFIDWACLRPPTETEFEKAARGAQINNLGEYAWGNTNISDATNISAAEGGTEVIFVGNCNYNNTAFVGGDAGAGPFRGGILACAGCDRESAGSSYYGIMELSGNVKEFVVALHATPATNVYTREWGNGAVDLVTADHDVATWPAFNAVVANASINNIFGLKGGSWQDAFAFQQISNRQNIYTTAILAATRASSAGGRGVR